MYRIGPECDRDHTGLSKCEKGSQTEYWAHSDAEMSAGVDEYGR